MHIRTAWLTAAAMLTLATPAWAQQNATPPADQSAAAAPAPDITKVNFVDFGFRGTAYTEGSDEARHQRYRDQRNGPTIDAFQFVRESATRWFSASADHVGYRDQHYAVSLNQYGKVKASFDWNQIPLFFSQDTRSLHASESAGVLRIDDAIQSQLQDKTATLPDVVGLAIPFEMRLKRNIADFKVTYEARPNLDLNLTVKNTTKDGSQPWAGTFGFSNAVELAVPVDTRTTELGADLEWTSPRGSAKVGYDSSLFRNNIDTLVWDSPLRVADSSTAGPSQGRMSLWPDSTLNTGSVLGTLNLPGRSRATGYISLGNWSQNEALVPFTINSTLPVIPLDRGTADLQALVTAMNYAFTSRPSDTLSFVARYRSYDFDNHSPEFHVTKTVSYDTSVADFAKGGTSPYSLNRKTFDAEMSYTPLAHTALRAGYTLEHVGQTFRYVDTTTENTLRLSADLTGTNWLTVRGVYEHAKRVGSGFDDQVLDDIDEQTSLRQFDISDRSADRFSTIVMVMPTASLSVNGSVTLGDDDRSDTGFGVLNGHSHSYSVGADFVPRDAVSLGVSYTYERYGTLQRSRQANPGPEFDDPTRDWTTDAHEGADTVTASLDLIKAWPRTDVSVAYSFSHADSLYVYGLTPDTTLPPVQQLPSVMNRLQGATVDVRYYLTRHTALGVRYWFDQYRVDDFAQGAETLTSIAQPSFLMIGYTDRPYTANSLVGRVTYIW